MKRFYSPATWMTLAILFAVVTSARASLHRDDNATAPVPTFTLTASPETGTLSPGNTFTYQVTVTPQNGFNSQVILGINGQAPPPNVSSVITPPMITPGTQPVKATVQLYLPPVVPASAHPIKSARRFTWRPLAGGVTLALLLWPFRARWSRLSRWPISLIALAVLSLALTSCGSSSTQVYQMVIYGTSGQMTQTSTVYLEVNQQ